MTIKPRAGEVSGRSRTNGLRHGKDEEKRDMRPRSSYCLSAALAAGMLLPAAVQAQINPFRGYQGPALSAEDNRLLLESVARLNAAEPTRIGRSAAWSNLQTNSSGTSTILRVFRSDSMACHPVLHRIVIAGRLPSHDYRLTWCRTPSGEWKIKG